MQTAWAAPSNANQGERGMPLLLLPLPWRLDEAAAGAAATPAEAEEAALADAPAAPSGLLRARGTAD
jgi:hypothetical protein